MFISLNKSSALKKLSTYTFKYIENSDKDCEALTRIIDI